MPKICYWRGAIGEEALLELHKQAIQELVDGTYASTDLESLEGHRDIFSYRVSGSGRLLFTTIERDGARYLLLLEYLPTHDYHKSRFLRSQVLSQYLIKHEEELAQAAFQFKPVTAPPAALENLAKTDEQDLPLECYKGLFIHLNTIQEEALKVTLPAVISGPGGSGKSCVAMSLLSEYVHQSGADLDEEEITILYVSASDELVRLMERSWHELPISQDMPVHINVRFFTYKELLREQGALQDKTVVDRDDFEVWYKEYQKKQQRLKKASHSECLKLDTHTVYQEFRICSAGGYAELGERDSSLPKGDARKLLEDAYQAYIQSLSDRNAIHPEFHALRDNSCHMVLVDEAQAFSRLQLENLTRLAKHHRAAFFMDTHQALSDVKSVRPFLLNLLRHQIRKEVPHIELTQGYRCPLNITRAANEIIRVKHQLTGGLADKAEVTSIVPHVTKNADAGHVVVLNEDTLRQWTWLIEQSQGAHFAVITSPEYVVALGKLFPPDRVFTYEQIKGLEYDTVVVFHPFVGESFKRAYQQLNSQSAAATPQHRPKAGIGDDTFTIPFNELFLAFTRAKKRLVILSEQRTIEERCFLAPLLAIMGNTSLPEVEQDQSTSAQDWINEIRRQIDHNQVERAFSIFLKIFKPDGDARQAFEAQYINPTIPIAAAIATESVAKEVTATPVAPPVAPISPKPQKKHPKKSEACQDTAPIPLTTEAEHVLALLNDFSEKRFLTLANIYGLEKLCSKIPITFDGKNTVLLAHILNSKEKTQLFASFIVNNLSLLLNMTMNNFADFIKQGPAKKCAQKEVLKDLISLTEDLDRRCLDVAHNAVTAGFTLSFIAALRGDIVLLVKLSRLGADLDRPMNDGSTPSFIAAQNGQIEALKVLKKLGADIDKASNDGSTPAFIAAQDGRVDVLRALSDLGADLNKPMHNGSTPALIAAERGYEKVVRTLFELGANFDRPMHSGCTAAFNAAQAGHLNIILFLLEIKADFTKPFISTIDSLIQFAQNVTPPYPRLIARIRKKIDERLALGDSNDAIALLPIDIAEVMGHDSVVREIRLKMSQKHLPTLSLLSDSGPARGPSKERVETVSPRIKDNTCG